MKYILVLGCCFFIASCSTSRQNATDSYHDNGPRYTIPVGMNNDNCNGANKENLKCYSDASKNNTITIGRTQVELSSITYIDAPAGSSYRYYARYNMWLDLKNYDDYSQQEMKKCLDEKFPEKSVPMSITPIAYAGGWTDCETFLRDLEENQKNIEVKIVKGKLKAFVFSSGDGPGAWKTAFIENPNKSETYKIVCSATDPSAGKLDSIGSSPNNEWLKFRDTCLDTILDSWEF